MTSGKTNYKYDIIINMTGEKLCIPQRLAAGINCLKMSVQLHRLEKQPTDHFTSIDARTDALGSRREVRAYQQIAFQTGHKPPESSFTW